jgi:hypothetical protein
LLPVSSCSLGNNALCRNCWLSDTFVLLSFSTPYAPTFTSSLSDASYDCIN